MYKILHALLREKLGVNRGPGKSLKIKPYKVVYGYL